MVFGKRSNETFRVGKHGFSLIEVLVSLFLLSLMSVLILSGMSGGNAATERARRVTAQSEIWAVQRYLKDVLNCAQALPIPAVNPRIQPVIDGKSDELMFVTCHTVPGQYGGFYVTQLSQLRSPDNPSRFDLWIEQKLFHRHGDIFAQSKRVTPRSNVLRDIKSLDLRYFGSPKAGSQPEWLSTWEQQARLPDLIQVKVEFPDKDFRIWPSLLAKLNINNPR